MQCASRHLRLLLVVALLAGSAARLPGASAPAPAAAAANPEAGPAPQTAPTEPDARQLKSAAAEHARELEQEQVAKPFHLTPETTACLLLSLVVSALSNAAGVGGGAVFVPLFHTALGFSIKLSTALSQAVITCGALGSVAYSLGRRHPTAPNHTLIDFDLALSLAPALLLGVSTGVLLNLALPTWLITILLVALLVTLTYRTARTGLRQARKAQQAQRKQAEALSAPSPQRQRRGSSQPKYVELPRQGEPVVHEGDEQAQQALAQQKRSGGGGAGREGGPSPDWQIGAAARASSEGLASDCVIAVVQPIRQQSVPLADGDACRAGGTTPASRHVVAVSATAAPPKQHPRLALLGQGASLPGAAYTNEGSAGGSDAGGSSVGEEEEQEEEEEAGGRCAGSTAVSRWMSAPGCLDGVLDPGTARSSPLPGDAPRAGAFAPAVHTPDAASEPSLQARAGYRRSATISSSRELSFDWARTQPPAPWQQQQQGQGGQWQGDQAAAAEEQQGQQWKDDQEHPRSADGDVTSAAATTAAPPQAAPLRFPWGKAGQLLLLWCVFFAFQFGKRQFSRCSWQFGVLYACQALLALALTLFFSWQATRGAEAGRGGEDSGEEQPILGAAAVDSSSVAPEAAAAAAGAGASAQPDAAPFVWTRRDLALASAVCLGGGCVAGTLGIGGGMLIAPLLLELGVHPQSASATSGLLVLFSASSAVIAFAAAGRLNLEYAAVFGTACLLAAFAGTFLIGRAVRRSGRAYLLVLILAGIIGLGAAVTAAFAGRHAVADILDGVELSSGADFCG